jgi:phosphate-selective porin OprO and OprP
MENQQNNMNLKTIILGVAILFTVTPLFSQDIEPITWKSYWNNGFNLKSNDGNFALKFGGRIQADMTFLTQNEHLDTLFRRFGNGFEFRRVRFYNSGTVYKILNYKLQLDFAGGITTFKDVWIGVKGIKGLGNLKFGNFKEPIRLEALTSSKYITFMERAPTVSFIPERNVGLMFSNHVMDDRLTWAFGLFRRGDKIGNQKTAGRELNLTARLTGLPYYDKENKRLVHIGGAYSYRSPQLRIFEITSRPESHLLYTIIKTGAITNVNHYQIAQGELAVVSGPFSFQGEFITSLVSSSPYDSLSETIINKDYTFLSYYAYVSYFITGESRSYKSSTASFSRVKPKKNVGQGGAGAWEVALRYSASDLNDLDVNGGRSSAVTVGVNWYLNPVSRVMLNYVYTNLIGVDELHIIQTRFQIDF